MVTKEQEIRALTALITMNGYFAEYFKRDLQTMTENIRNDFPIELGTKFHFTEERLHETENRLAEAHRTEIIELCDTLLRIAAETGNTQAYEQAVAKLGLECVIIRKRKIGLDISGTEIDYLLSQLERPK